MYFIGILGERYGWTPRFEDVSKDQELVHDYPWIEQCIADGISVTEMEILYGVLNNPSMREQAFFYFRDADTTPQEFKETVQDPIDKLASVKDRVRGSNYPVRENFASPEELGAWVRRDLLAVVDELYPAEEAPTPLEREHRLHEAFALTRRRAYVARAEYLEALDAHAKSEAGPLAVIGESGSGKSSLLAFWAEPYRQANPDAFIIEHYVGATSSGGGHAALMRRIFYPYHGTQAWVEMAKASGWTTLEPHERHPYHLSTYGTGLLVSDALAMGMTDITIFCGGSSTVDGGLGLGMALGYQFLDHQGQPLPAKATSLPWIKRIIHPKPHLTAAKVTMAVDVNNPLTGPDGSALVYGPQKGASLEECQWLDDGLMHLRRQWQQWCGMDPGELPGAGSAGGLWLLEGWPSWGVTFVRIKITDQGPGIAESDHETVFKPFTRLEPSRNAQTGGVGLGLSIARAVAQSHGGDITLENQRELRAPSPGWKSPCACPASCKPRWVRHGSSRLFGVSLDNS